MIREDTFSVRVSVDGVDLGTWDKSSGGAVDSSETKYKPGGMAQEVSLGGSRTTENVTVTRLNDPILHAFVPWLLGRAGRGSAVVVRQPLDENGAAFGRPITWRGKLKSVTLPDTDSEGDGAALVALEVSTVGTPS